MKIKGGGGIYYIYKATPTLSFCAARGRRLRRGMMLIGKFGVLLRFSHRFHRRRPKLGKAESRDLHWFVAAEIRNTNDKRRKCT